MIINSEEDLKVGQITHGLLTDTTRTWKEVTFLVLRIATKEEYLDYTREHKHFNPLAPYFYEIHMD